MNKMKRSELSDLLQSAKAQLKKDVMFITSFRATKDNSIQVEVCQNRELGGRKQTLLGLLNKSDKRFRDTTTLLFDWMTLTPQDFVNAFPDHNVTVEQLQQIASTWTPNAPTGKDATVYAFFQKVTHIYDAANDVKLTPVLVVTELTESQLANGEFFRGKNAEERIAASLDDDRNVMKTGPTDEDEYIVHPETGERVFRFTRTEFAENNPVDSIIEGKITQSEFQKRANGYSSNTISNKKMSVADLGDLLNQGDSV